MGKLRGKEGDNWPGGMGFCWDSDDFGLLEGTKSEGVKVENWNICHKITFV